jgi:adenylate cyclase
MQDAAANIARQLAQDDQARRIYKLLIYVSEGAWVGEIAPPSEAMIQRGLRQILQQFSDFAHLRSHIHASVNTLSKPAEYSEVADIILEAIAQAHGGSVDDPTTTFLRVLPDLSIAPEKQVYPTIATQISALPNQLRLKKLAFCVAYSVWEGDATKLDALSWVDLARALHQRYERPSDLTQAFQQVVNRLSKPIEYSLLSENLLAVLSGLYQVASAETVANFIPDPLKGGLFNEVITHEVISEDPIHVSSITQGPLTEQLPTAPWSEGNSVGNGIIESIDSVIFDLHYDILKQANPLRLKHLLLMLIHNLDPDEAIDGLNLRQQSTMPLLAVTFRLHRKPEILAIKLREIARKLLDSEEYEGTIESILRAFKQRSVTLSQDGISSPHRRVASNEASIVTGVRA